MANVTVVSRLPDGSCPAGSTLMQDPTGREEFACVSMAPFPPANPSTWQGCPPGFYRGPDPTGREEFVCLPERPRTSPPECPPGTISGPDPDGQLEFICLPTNQPMVRSTADSTPARVIPVMDMTVPAPVIPVMDTTAPAPRPGDTTPGTLMPTGDFTPGQFTFAPPPLPKPVRTYPPCPPGLVPRPCPPGWNRGNYANWPTVTRGSYAPTNTIPPQYGGFPLASGGAAFAPEEGTLAKVAKWSAFAVGLFAGYKLIEGKV